MKINNKPKLVTNDVTMFYTKHNIEITLFLNNSEKKCIDFLQSLKSFCRLVSGKENWDYEELDPFSQKASFVIEEENLKKVKRMIKNYSWDED